MCMVHNRSVLFQTRKEVWFSLSRCSALKVNDLLHKFCVVVNSRKQDGISIPNANKTDVYTCTSNVDGHGRLLMCSHEEWGNKTPTNNYNLQNILPGQYHTVMCEFFLSVCLFIYTQCGFGSKHTTIWAATKTNTKLLCLLSFYSN